MEGAGSGSTASGHASGFLEEKALEGKRRRAMTVDEKAMYERGRNRLHARNARARKRQYVEELKERVESLQGQKIQVERQKVEKAQRKEDKKRRWEGTLRRVLHLRCEGVVDEDTWREVISENFRFTLPLMPYRSSNPSDEVEHRRVLTGIDGMISDTKSLMEMCINLAKDCSMEGGAGGTERGTQGGSMAGGGGGNRRVNIEYLTGTDNFLFEGDDGIMCTFIMRTTNAMHHGGLMEAEKKGMLRCCFAADGKMNELDMLFDGIVFDRQLKKITRMVPTEGWPSTTFSSFLPLPSTEASSLDMSSSGNPTGGSLSCNLSTTTTTMTTTNTITAPSLSQNAGGSNPHGVSSGSGVSSSPTRGLNKGPGEGGGGGVKEEGAEGNKVEMKAISQGGAALGKKEAASPRKEGTGSREEWAGGNMKDSTIEDAGEKKAGESGG